MDKALSMGKISAAGSLQLFLGRIASTVIMAVGTIILGLFILQSDYGLYTIALIPAGTFLLFQDLGVGPALIRYCARCRAANDAADLRKAVIASFVFEVGTGVVLTTLSLLTASFIAADVFRKPESGFLIAVASATILSSAISAVPGSVFVGLENMKLRSVTLLVGAVVQSLFGPLLVLLGFGALGAVVGYTLGTVMMAAVSIFCLYFYIMRKLPKQKTTRRELQSLFKPLLAFGIPYAAATILNGLATQFSSFMMASYCLNADIGTYKIATNFTMLLGFFSVPISTVLFPAFSKIDPVNEKPLLKSVYASSSKYTAFLLVPATMALIALGGPLIGTLYGNKWLGAPLFLVFLIVSNLLAVFGTLSAPNLLLALGETKFLLKLNIGYLALAVIMAVLLIPPFGMIGVLSASLVAILPTLIVTVYVVWKRYGIAVDMKDAGRIVLTSLVAFIPTYFFETLSMFSFLTNLIIGILCFLGIFMVTAPFVGAIKQIDIDNLRIMFSENLILSKIMDIPLHIFEKIIRIKDGKRLFLV